MTGVSNKAGSGTSSTLVGAFNDVYGSRNIGTGNTNKINGKYCFYLSNDNRYNGSNNSINGQFNNIQGNVNAVKGSLNKVTGNEHKIGLRS